jgi:hypothetical protein
MDAAAAQSPVFVQAEMRDFGHISEDLPCLRD